MVEKVSLEGYYQTPKSVRAYSVNFDPSHIKYRYTYEDFNK
jgi:hypothetical protein